MNTLATTSAALAELHRDLSLVLPELHEASSPVIAACVEGRRVEPDAAIARAVQLLRECTAPAIVGLGGLSIEGVRKAVALAERCRAKLLPTPMHDPAAANMTVLQTATLGHAMAADLKVVVGTNTQVGSAARQGPPPPGVGATVVGASRAGDSAVGASVPDRIDQAITARVPNTLFVAGDLDTILALRQSARSKGERAAELFTDATALPVKRVVVLLPHDCDIRVAIQWHKLAAQLQRQIRVAVLALPHPLAANLRGALEVITWQTGLSCATGGVDFADGAPKPCAGAATLLPGGACDIVIDTGWSPMPVEWRKRVKHYIRIGAAKAPALLSNAPAQLSNAPAQLSNAPAPSPLRGERAGVRGETHDIAETTDVSFTTPGLAQGLAARVMRFDGAILWLCDDPTPGAASPDPTVDLLRHLASGDSLERL